MEENDEEAEQVIQREEGQSDKMRNEGEMMKRATERRVKTADDLRFHDVFLPMFRLKNTAKFMRNICVECSLWNLPV